MHIASWASHVVLTDRKWCAVQEDAPAVWRGPMVMSALDSFMTKVSWAPLDVLVIDMPPGTGTISNCIDKCSNTVHLIMLSQHTAVPSCPHDQYVVTVLSQCCHKSCNSLLDCKTYSRTCDCQQLVHVICIHFPDLFPEALSRFLLTAGDAQISIGQRLTLSGAVIVSTPQVLNSCCCSSFHYAVSSHKHAYTSSRTCVTCYT